MEDGTQTVASTVVPTDRFLTLLVSNVALHARFLLDQMVKKKYFVASVLRLTVEDEHPETTAEVIPTEETKDTKNNCLVRFVMNAETIAKYLLSQEMVIRYSVATVLPVKKPKESLIIPRKLST